MAEICKKCGLPLDLCVCKAIAKEAERISVYTITKRYGKKMTVIDNISPDINLKEMCKKLKQILACGGTYKDGKIELQGDHLGKIKDVLVELGFSPDQIEV
jgi:translation initiation factor 1